MSASGNPTRPCEADGRELLSQLMKRHQVIMDLVTEATRKKPSAEQETGHGVGILFQALRHFEAMFKITLDHIGKTGRSP